MALDDTPLAYDGTSSGVAWWRHFTLWVARHGISSSELILQALEASLRGKALIWYNALTDAQHTNWLVIKPLFLAKFPADDDALLPEEFGSPQEDLYQFLEKKLEPRDLLDVVEVPPSPDTAQRTQLYRYQWWGVELHRRIVKIPIGSMNQDSLGYIVKKHLPDVLTGLVPSNLTSAKLIAKHIVQLPKDTIFRVVDQERRLAAVESLARTVHARSTPNTGTYVTQSSSRSIPASTSSSTTTANAPTTSSPTASSATTSSASSGLSTVLAPGDHLVYTDDAAGHKAYKAAIDKYDAAYGTGLYVSINRPLPLTPGTPPPGPGKCNGCGEEGHLQNQCPRPPLPERERRFRGMCAAAMRRKVVDTKFVNVIPNFEATTALGQGNA